MVNIRDQVEGLSDEIERLASNETVFSCVVADLRSVVAHNANVSNRNHKTATRLHNMTVFTLMHNGAFCTRQCSANSKRALRARLTWAKPKGWRL